MTAFEVGVDVGGTFTDLALTDGERLVVAKVPSTPLDQARGVLHGLEGLAADPGRLRAHAEVYQHCRCVPGRLSVC